MGTGLERLKRVLSPFRFFRLIMKGFDVKNVIRVSAYLLLLLGVPILAYLSKPAEMLALTISSSIALAFVDIDKFKRIKGGGFEAELKEQVEAVIEKETEVDTSLADENASPLQAEVDKSISLVLQALDDPSYTWRYVSGIKKATGLDDDNVAGAVAWLVVNGFARRSQGKHGPIYSLTEQGRHLSIVQSFDDLGDNRN